VTATLPDTLPDMDWRRRPGLDRLLAALDADKGMSRYVGGAVRDSLLGIPVADVDIATRHVPQKVMTRLQRAGIRAVPTGIDHGTVTAVLDGWPVEITTLRRDVATDGRRATIAYSDDWREDAARRDFTINALYADPLSGKISDYFGGLDDLKAGRIRFIGNAADRIEEDHLRILRYFRFVARFGVADPQAEAYRTCVARANSLMALSRERIADELLKLLATADPLPALRLMADGGIFRPVLPEIEQAGIERLEKLIAREAASGVEPSALRRLAALLPPDSRIADSVGARLKLSNKARKRLALAHDPAWDGIAKPGDLAYRIGRESAIDRLLLDSKRPVDETASLLSWEKPHLPVSGGALVKRGLAAGPLVARALQQIEQRWIEEGYPDAGRVNAIADEVVAHTLSRPE
jgi:poly(A) polymerase